jgi:hypothetical protein
MFFLCKILDKTMIYNKNKLFKQNIRTLVEHIIFKVLKWLNFYICKNKIYLQVWVGVKY